jgi:hypothetical protein
MTAIVVDDVTDLCTDITHVSAVWLAWVNTKINVDNFDGEDGLTTKIIRCYLAAHFTTIGDLGGAVGGPVQSTTEGGISRAYAVTDLSDNALKRTSYGAAALGLLRMYVVGAGIASA